MLRCMWEAGRGQMLRQWEVGCSQWPICPQKKVESGGGGSIRK